MVDDSISGVLIEGLRSEDIASKLFLKDLAALNPLGNNLTEMPGIYIGIDLAKVLQLKVGDKINIMSEKLLIRQLAACQNQLILRCWEYLKLAVMIMIVIRFIPHTQRLVVYY